MNFRLQIIRENKELTQSASAEYLKVTQSSYSRWENGLEIIPLGKLILFAKYFHVNLDYICNLTNNIKENKNYKIDKEIIGKNITTFRREHNLTQKDLANFLNTTPSTICAYEKGKTLILTSFIYQICSKYNLSLDKLCNLN